MSRAALGVVTRFELTRTLRKPQFWVTALLLPAIMAAAVLIVAWAGDARPEATKPVSFEYRDHSGLISETVASALGGSPARSGAQGRAQAGEIDAYIVFPVDPLREPVTIVAQDRGIIANGDYAAVAGQLFTASVDATLDSPKTVELVRATPRTQLSTFAAGQPAAGLGAMIVPGLLAILLVLIVSLLGNQMLNSTVEEKENRISEMLLVSLPARALIMGKILALALVGLIQIGILAVGCLIIYISTSSWLKLDAIGITTVTLDPVRIGVGLLLLVGGVLVMTGLLVLIGAAMPTAKDAAPNYTGVVLFTIVPLYLISTILVSPNSPVIHVLTYFPLTAPMTALLLNATGALHPLVGVGIGLGLLLIGAVILQLAIRTFQRGVLQFDRPLRLKDLGGSA
ncbi:ABC transporter permease [Leifsonia sp. AG29]|uniref:ABC transporter permease n=1 Tax=Leifsonia sp. AG29 TaxID=2598860 RepID=UPI00131C20CA|nr:ABC transporter permease [Leifsonia sp. AG29]